MHSSQCGNVEKICIFDQMKIWPRKKKKQWIDQTSICLFMETTQVVWHNRMQIFVCSLIFVCLFSYILFSFISLWYLVLFYFSLSYLFSYIWHHSAKSQPTFVSCNSVVWVRNVGILGNSATNKTNFLSRGKLNWIISICSVSIDFEIELKSFKSVQF